MTKICVKNANTMCDAALAASSNLGWRVVLKEKSADILMHSQATANALVVDITTIKPNQKVSKIPGSSHVAKKTRARRCVLARFEDYKRLGGQ
mmetsp:Transcript_8810/g.17683  ORF Transcript_8810/g.17683 Transcript_8810/m.17683 type:complete len:93 (-) Transcript_8810:1425-1703(-)